MWNTQERIAPVEAPVAVRIEVRDPLLRAGLAAMLRTAPGAAVDGDSDIVLWDGQGALPSGRVLALVADPEHARMAWQGGARGLLHKDAQAAQVVQACKALRSGLAVVDPAFSSVAQPGASLAEEGLEALTDRETEVIELMAEGLSNKDIGLALGVTAHTAKFHVAAILGKLRAATRTEAVVRAARLGLLAI